MPTAEYMREYRKRPGVRERELRNKREYDLWHQEPNRARWRRRNAERKAAKAAYEERFGQFPGFIDIRLMRKSLKDGIDHLADRRAADASSREEREHAATSPSSRTPSDVRPSAKPKRKGRFRPRPSSPTRG